MRVTVATIIGLALLAGFTSAATATDEPIAISRVVEDPQAYHMRMVTLQGTVRQVEALEPYAQRSGTTCYGAYLFTLEDEAESLTVAVLGLCGKPIIRDPGVSDGERVTVRAQIYAPGRLGGLRGSDGRPVAGADHELVHAVASEIIHEGQ